MAHKRAHTLTLAYNTKLITPFITSYKMRANRVFKLIRKILLFEYSDRTFSAHKRVLTFTRMLWGMKEKTLLGTAFTLKRKIN